ncbi:unnamed protein product [Polarella glacialis]|uniref:Uncharacterized protein n=1 Tax=Polarella glacialis TaxID=89957 RepID=A0A813JL20_POLGL|nr:unnamed protein product [Polarella glacialis]CAE8680737.1 unnamed protein product [Polarella glacialis]|mmetsp:Transcript_64260/g.103901  ORF Transcript_64260/g.103901 Transcript_64260/m.103901 type:complete len:106 (-) Transcript_64260:133-450(-)
MELAARQAQFETLEADLDSEWLGVLGRAFLAALLCYILDKCFTMAPQIDAQVVPLAAVDLEKQQQASSWQRCQRGAIQAPWLLGHSNLFHDKAEDKLALGAAEQR